MLMEDNVPAFDDLFRFDIPELVKVLSVIEADQNTFPRPGFEFFTSFLWYCSISVVAVPAMSSLISSFALSHICTCFGLCSSLGGHVCRDSYGRAKL